MVESIKGYGKKVKCTEKVCILGQTEENILEISLMIKKKDMEFSNGLMVEFLMDFGKMDNKTEKELIYSLIRKRERAFGKMDKDKNGLINDIIKHLLII